METPPFVSEAPSPEYAPQENTSTVRATSMLNRQTLTTGTELQQYQMRQQTLAAKQRTRAEIQTFAGSSGMLAAYGIPWALSLPALAFPFVLGISLGSAMAVPLFFKFIDYFKQKHSLPQLKNTQNKLVAA